MDETQSSNENTNKLHEEDNAKVTSYEKSRLLSRLTVAELKKIQLCFEDGQKRDVGEFCELLSQVLAEDNMAEFRELFHILDTDKEGFIDWNKLCSHMQRDYQEKDARRKTTQVPQWRELKYITRHVSATLCHHHAHKENIQRITMLSNPARYITLSKEGVVVIWSLNMKPLRTIYVTAEVDEIKQRDLWVTDFVPLQNVYKIALTLTSKEIAIYDLSSKSEFLCQYRIIGLFSTPICVNYWSNSENPNESILVFGDVEGKVNALIFCASTISLFDRPAQTNTNQKDTTLVVDLKDIMKGRYQNCRYVFHNGHTEWTRQVLYNSSLECFISCATNYKNALVLGWREKNKTEMRTTTFKISQGVNAFDYNEKINLIATAGVNHHVLLWNPYVISKPVGILRGHMQTVLCVKFIEERGQTVSLSKDKVLRIWDTNLQVCLQRLSGIFAKGPETSMVMFFDTAQMTLLTAFNHRLSMLVMKQEVKDRVISHEQPVVGVLYNRKFNQVVSACIGSVINMWMVDTGQKVKQFTNAHGESEITRIVQDASQTRLFTGSSDGTVKIWDLNGHCHHVLVAGDGEACDISDVLPLKRMILVVGWDRTLCVFRDSQLTSYYVHPSDWKGRQEHQDDIQTMAFTSPHTLATASYDGKVVLWNSASELAFRHFAPQKRSQHEDSCESAQPIGDEIDGHVNSDEESEDVNNSPSYITKMIFLDQKRHLTDNGTLFITCSANGWVRFWNTNHNSCFAEFVAHSRAGPITMAADFEQRYLVTADNNGMVKVWSILEYSKDFNHDKTKTKSPLLHAQFQAHLDAVTDICVCERFERTLIMTASSDCSVALWDIHGRHVGIFGQEEHWKIGDIPLEKPSGEEEEVEMDHTVQCCEQQNETGMSDLGTKDDCYSKASETDCIISTWNSSILGKAYTEPRREKRARRQPENNVNKEASKLQEKTTFGTYCNLETSELSSVKTLEKPDFVTNPGKYFADDSNLLTYSNSSANNEECSPTSEHVIMRFDEKNLFPRHILEMEAKMKAAHVLATRGSRATTRTGATTRVGKPSPQPVKPQMKKRHNLSPQLEVPENE